MTVNSTYTFVLGEYHTILNYTNDFKKVLENNLRTYGLDLIFNYNKMLKGSIYKIF